MYSCGSNKLLYVVYVYYMYMYIYSCSCDSSKKEQSVMSALHYKY